MMNQEPLARLAVLLLGARGRPRVWSATTQPHQGETSSETRRLACISLPSSLRLAHATGRTVIGAGSSRSGGAARLQIGAAERSRVSRVPRGDAGGEHPSRERGIERGTPAGGGATATSGPCTDARAG